MADPRLDYLAKEVRVERARLAGADLREAAIANDMLRFFEARIAVARLMTLRGDDRG